MTATHRVGTWPNIAVIFQILIAKEVSLLHESREHSGAPHPDWKAGMKDVAAAIISLRASLFGRRLSLPHLGRNIDMSTSVPGTLLRHGEGTRAKPVLATEAVIRTLVRVDPFMGSRPRLRGTPTRSACSHFVKPLKRRKARRPPRQGGEPFLADNEDSDRRACPQDMPSP